MENGKIQTLDLFKTSYFLCYVNFTLFNILSNIYCTLTGHFIMYGLLVPIVGPPFFLQNCLNSSCLKFSKMLETFLIDFGPH